MGFQLCSFFPPTLLCPQKRSPINFREVFSNFLFTFSFSLNAPVGDLHTAYCISWLVRGAETLVDVLLRPVFFVMQCKSAGQEVVRHINSALRIKKMKNLCLISASSSHAIMSNAGQGLLKKVE